MFIFLIRNYFNKKNVLDGIQTNNCWAFPGVCIQYVCRKGFNATHTLQFYIYIKKLLVGRIFKNHNGLLYDYFLLFDQPWRHGVCAVRFPYSGMRSKYLNATFESHKASFHCKRDHSYCTYYSSLSTHHMFPRPLHEPPLISSKVSRV